MYGTVDEGALPSWDMFGNERGYIVEGPQQHWTSLNLPYPVNGAKFLPRRRVLEAIVN